MIALKTMKLAAIATSLVLIACGGRVGAVSIPILNHSFESPDAVGSFIDGVPTNWTGFAADGDLYTWVEAHTGIDPIVTGGDGLQHSGMEENGGYIYQDLGVPFQANKTYRLNLASYHRAGTNHATVQFGLFSSNTIGTNVGTPGFMDIQGVWDGAGNPDADNMFNVLRDASVLQTIDLNHDGIEGLGRMYSFDSGPTPPAGNIVVFIRHQGNGARIQYDNIRLDEVSTLQKGDVNLDGDVDLNDLTAIQSHFRTSVTSRSFGDLDEDGFVDFTDYLEWKAYFPFPGTGAGSSTNSGVPEPSSWILGIAGGLLTFWRRRAPMRRPVRRLA